MGTLQLQQGDVNITQLPSVPEPTQKRDGNVIREGESTGHSHRIEGTDFQLWAPRSGIRGSMVATIRSDDCQLVHEEHKPIPLPPGAYEFTPTVEYDHFAERSQFVRD